MNKLVRLGLTVVGGGAAVAALAAAGGWWWMTSTRDALRARTFETHEVDVPVPFPLSEEELSQLRAAKLAEAAAAGADASTDAAPAPDGAEAVEAAAADPLQGVDLEAIALERARARGKHLVEARYACAECHGQDFGGGVMMDDGAIGRWLGPNLTPGQGSRVLDYTMSDWDRVIRHGVLPDGRAALMPSDDFVNMSDRELSDIVAYIESLPPVDAEVEASTFGPIGTMLLATGKLPSSAEKHHDHMAPHAVEPPEAAVSVEFGAHLAQVCTGCHRPDLNGGPMPFGPPDWPPAGNLTPHESGLSGWTYEQFVTAMREGQRPDGTALRPPMANIAPMARKMTDVELQAMWTYLESLPATPTGT